MTEEGGVVAEAEVALKFKATVAGFGGSGAAGFDLGSIFNKSSRDEDLGGAFARGNGGREELEFDEIVCGEGFEKIGEDIDDDFEVNEAILSMLLSSLLNSSSKFKSKSRSRSRKAFGLEFEVPYTAELLSSVSSACDFGINACSSSSWSPSSSESETASRAGKAADALVRGSESAFEASFESLLSLLTELGIFGAFNSACTEKRTRSCPSSLSPVEASDSETTSESESSSDLTVSAWFIVGRSGGDLSEFGATLQTEGTWL